MGHPEKECISIFTIDGCNIACKYCYLSNLCSSPVPEKTTKKTIDLDFAKRGILDYLQSHPRPHVRFFANGEPTLNFQAIRDLTSFTSKESGGRATYELQTNGVFGENIRRWIKENMDIVWVSMDGPEEINDVYRRGKNNQSVSKIVEDTLKSLVDNQTKKIGVRATISSINAHRQNEIIDYFCSLGVNYIYSDLMFAQIGNTLPINGAISPLTYAKEFLLSKEYAKTKNIFYGSIFEVNFDKPTTVFCRANLPSPHLTVDGFVTCCDMAVDGNSFPQLVYGKYDSSKKKIDYDQTKIALIQNRTINNLKACSGCSCSNYCGGGCLGEAVNLHGELLEINDAYCDAIRYLASKQQLPLSKFPVHHP